MLDASLIRAARRKAGLTQRALAERAGTSHATLAAYESGAKVPRLDTAVRIIRAAGFEPEVDLAPRPDGSTRERVAKGEELTEALALAAMFPASRRPAHLPPPALPRRATTR